MVWTICVDKHGDNMKRIGRIRLSIDIPERLYERIKELAGKRNVTLTKIVVRALILRLNIEDKYDKDPI
jgi:hypothetical protein